MKSQLLAKARAVAEEVFKDKAFEKRSFHNLQHTLDVVAATEEIALQSALTPDETESALIAAWLHDIGYAQGAENHERKAADKARELLTEWGVKEKQISEVTEAIIATKVPQQPRSMIAKVLCDADLYHLSSDSCKEKSELLRKEWEDVGDRFLSDEDWIRTNLEFMERHEYHTPYGQSVLQKAKKKNIKRIRKNQSGELKSSGFNHEINKLKAKLDKAKNKPDRGIETMFRTTSHNHLMLSQMADNKANILITINSIILSVVVSVLVRKLEENPNLIVPTIMLIVVCLSTTVFAILATRPNLSSGRFTRDEVKGKRINLLFFGNFHGMNIEDYEWSMKEMMKDSDYLYGSMIKDIYYLGKVLGKKYKFLRLAYNIFMFGFVVSVMSFIVVFMMTPRS